MGIAAILIGFIIILTGGLKVLILLIQKLFGAQKFTATIAEYKKLNGNDHRMYLTIEHEKAPAQIWLAETIRMKDDKPAEVVGSSLEVYWIPGKKTVMRADTVKRGVISLAVGVAAIVVGIVLLTIGASVE